MTTDHTDRGRHALIPLLVTGEQEGLYLHPPFNMWAASSTGGHCTVRWGRRGEKHDEGLQTTTGP